MIKRDISKKIKGIQLSNVGKTYANSNDKAIPALKEINLHIKPGEFVGIAGKNGSGKTTLARLLNGLLLPSQGIVMINGMNTRNQRDLIQIRRQVAMVFQNPENQIINPVVEEEIAFGPENLNLPLHVIEQRVENAIKLMGLEDYRYHAPHLLSGGQKQRVAIAGALAMSPDYLVLDEPTSMLDQGCRQNLMEYLEMLNKEHGITIILISHCMDDLARATRLLVLEEGSIIADAPPQEVFYQDKILPGLKSPDIVALVKHLELSGIYFNKNITTCEEMVKQLCQLSKCAM